MIKILIAEDEAIVAEDLEHSLRHLGYEVVGPVARGREAIELARDRHPDVVLMDIELTGPIDGVAAAEHIRTNLDLPVVFLTAHSDSATMERACQTEPFGYILKPFEERELRTSIEMARYRHRIERRLREAHEQATWLARFPGENPGPVLRVTLDGTVLYANPVAVCNPAWTCGHGEQVVPSLRALVERAMVARQPIEEDVDLEGTTYAVAVAVFPEERYVNLYGRDITELRAMQRREMDHAIQQAWGQSASEMINAMHEGVALLERDGTILSVNPAAERMIGRDGGTVVGCNIGDLLRELLTETDLGQVLEHMAAFRRGEKPSFRPLQLRSRGAKAIHVLPSLTTMSEPHGRRKLALLTLRDVTKLHDAWQALARSEKKYRDLVENADSIIMRVSPDHTITFFNEYAQRFFGYTAAEVLGRSVIGTITPAVDSENHDPGEMLRDINITTRPELHAGNDNENQCKDGRRVWVHWTNRAICDQQGKVVEILCVGTDISLRRKMEAEAREYHQRLRNLSERLAATEEEDRWRISRFVHDTIIQNLSLSSIRLASMAKPLAEADLPEEADKLRRVRTLIEDAIDECRRVMSDLTPSLLYELGLVPALHDLARQLETKHGTPILVEPSGAELSLPPPLRGFLFQAARELVMNALKYAGPCKIVVSVSSRDGRLTLSVADKGCGFDPSTVDAPRDHKGGFGLFNIRQRLEALDGRIDIRSAYGKGTTATISVPLP